VVIALFVISFMILSVSGGLHTVSSWTLATAIQNEADRLLQAEAERLMSAPFVSVGASSDESIVSSVKTSFGASTQAQFSYPTGDPSARVAFTRRVVDIATTPTSRHLRVEVEWTWQGRDRLISSPLFRSH
jgi:hypothetical protein